MALTPILQDFRNHAANGAAHGATSAKTPGTTMARDAAGRTKAADPAVADDVATKGYADAIVATETTARANADAALNGRMAAAEANLSAEASARAAGDAGLQTQVDALAGSIGGLGTATIITPPSFWSSAGGYVRCEYSGGPSSRVIGIYGGSIPPPSGEINLPGYMRYVNFTPVKNQPGIWEAQPEKQLGGSMLFVVAWPG